MKREDIDSIIIHCSATRAGQDLRAKDIDRMHRARGFNQIGYNYVIGLDGMIEEGRPLTVDGAHCNTKGFPVNRITSIRSVYAMLVDWTQTVNRQIPALRLKGLVYAN